THACKVCNVWYLCSGNLLSAMAVYRAPHASIGPGRRCQRLCTAISRGPAGCRNLDYSCIATAVYAAVHVQLCSTRCTAVGTFEREKRACSGCADANCI